MAPRFHLSSLLLLGNLGIFAWACDPGSSTKDTGSTPTPEDTGEEGDAVDADGDGHPASEDCDDTDATVHPDAEEVCDEDDVDEDCDGLADDEDDDVQGTTTWYPDSDGDGYGAAGGSVEACDAPTGHVGAGEEDCDDTDAAVHPEADEVCNGQDDDCDETTSETGLITVDGSLSAATLTEAIEASSEGSTIHVCEGTWEEGLVIPHSLTFVGPAGSAATVLQADGTEPVVTVEEGDLAMSGFTLTGGAGAVVSEEDGESVTAGGAIYAREASSLILENVLISENEADYGGGVFGPDAGTLTLHDVTLEDNTATSSGGAVYTWGTAFEGVVFQRCEAVYGGAVYIDDSDDETVTGTWQDVTITECTGSYGGGALVKGAEITVEDTLVTANTADRGGGLYLREFTTWTGGEISSNTAEYGGGAYLYSDTALAEAELLDNTATTGGGLRAREGATLDSLHLEGNAADSGGGMAVNGDLEASDVVVTANEADSYGGGILFDGGVQTFRGGEITGNSATDNHGGAGLLYECDTTFEGVTISGNSAAWGAGFMMQQATAEADADTVVSENEASGYGGGLYTWSDAVWEGGRLEDNSAAGYGGAVYAYGITLLEDAEITGNTADAYGGGILAVGETAIEHCTVSENEAAVGGGMYIVEDAPVTVLDSTVQANVASDYGGGARLLEGTLTSTDSDWGTGGTDNDPDDVYTLETAYADYGTDDFSCDHETGCSAGVR